MANVTVSFAADSDWDEILDYLIDKAGKHTADQFNFMIEVFYDRLAEFPASGALRSKLGPQVRMGVISPYIILYRYLEKDNAVGIIRILHGSRKITRKLLKS